VVRCQIDTHCANNYGAAGEPMTNISKLCSWYARQCVDEWQEEFGIKISTLDNPGWSLKVDLERTNLSGKPFKEIKSDVSDTDWFVARKNGTVFEAFGGPLNLDEMIGVFVTWAI
jgi:hypothetical protein